MVFEASLTCARGIEASVATSNCANEGEKAKFCVWQLMLIKWEDRRQWHSILVEEDCPSLFLRPRR